MDARYREQLDVPTLARAARLSRAHFSREFQATYEELMSRGVEFQQEPTEQPYGIDAGFRDTSGNQMRVAQLA